VTVIGLGERERAGFGFRQDGCGAGLTSTRAKRAAGQYDLVLLYIVCLVIYIGKLRNSEVNWCS